MSKIGTAHVEIKPVLNEAELAKICREIETQISDAVNQGLALRTDSAYLERLASCVDNDVRYYHETAAAAPNGQEHLRALGQRIVDQVAACMAPEAVTAPDQCPNCKSTEPHMVGQNKATGKICREPFHCTNDHAAMPFRYCPDCTWTENAS